MADPYKNVGGTLAAMEDWKRHLWCERIIITRDGLKHTGEVVGIPIKDTIFGRFSDDPYPEYLRR
jgi:cellulase/cellobiase CelA1